MLLSLGSHRPYNSYKFHSVVGIVRSTTYSAGAHLASSGDDDQWYSSVLKLASLTVYLVLTTM